jgi:hypothetical protein
MYRHGCRPRRRPDSRTLFGKHPHQRSQSSARIFRRDNSVDLAGVTTEMSGVFMVVVDPACKPLRATGDAAQRPLLVSSAGDSNPVEFGIIGRVIPCLLNEGPGDIRAHASCPRGSPSLYIPSLSS